MMRIKKKEKLASKSDYAQALKMFKDGQPLTDVAIELDIDATTVMSYYEDYLKLLNMGRLVTIYHEVKDDLPIFIRLYGRIKKEGLSKSQIVEFLKTPNRLLDLKKRVDLFY